MKYWDYRIICKKDKKSKTTSFEVHEVYYSKKGKIKDWTLYPVAPFGENVKELKRDMKYFQDALKKPVLKEVVKSKKVSLQEVK